MKTLDTETQLLLDFIKNGKSPSHVVKHSVKILEEAGFEHLIMHEPWDLKPGHNYVTSVYDTSLFAFRIPENYVNGMPLHVATAHTDWPCLYIKSKPELTQGRYQKLNVEIYGGPLYYSWLDRPLSIAGTCCVEDDYSPHGFHMEYVDFKRPMAVIPSLAIHYNREANTNLSLNAQTDMAPLLDVIHPEFKHDGYFLRLLSEELGVSSDKVLSWDMNFYNMDEPVLYGEHTELLSAPRLDNLTAVAACISAIRNPANKNNFSAIMLFNNEEIGSTTKQGADSVISASVIESICVNLGGSRRDYINSTVGGFMMSCDVAHAIHPNKPALNDPTNEVYPGDGVAIKMTTSQRYATDVVGIASVRKTCKDHGIPYKEFFNRSDIRGGSTLGSILSATMGMRAVDIGPAILGMHSSRELMATADQTALAELLRQYM